ncbi:hypothetical protein L6654_16830 [Bradyrhizobium sp. WYCCWR 13023]|uniref:Uncharacterized protein n=1 Tax=Bradyrhizobium zhengyangense TaxID=2911009 RepID=A0A9X1RC14_9BRAD|nr:hypothetical protein [Bradyrhizobium zhengyangense]MCG2628298.1 hypothetical protein [Bradyrhizobium zhengyangense]
MASYSGYNLDHEQTERDRPLSFHWETVDFMHLLGLPAARNAHHEATINAIVAEAILAAEAGRRVSYSARRTFYSQGRRYRGTSYTYATMMRAIALLDRTGWISDHRVPPGNRGWQSSFVATEQLLDAWRSFGRGMTYAPAERVCLKNDAGELVDYRDTPLTLRIRGQLEERNEALAELRIDLPGIERRGHHVVIGGSFVLPIPRNPLRRIFSRSSWQLHGRAYSWFQSIPNTVRLSMTVNSEPVVECDYSSLHATILYNQVGIPFDGDAYSIDGFNRDEIKLGFNIAINAKNERAAVAALADHLRSDRSRSADVIAAIKRRHKPVERYFCSDAGVRLMRIDSELILTALKAVNDAGDPALPVHDALVVPARCAGRAQAAMSDSFERIVGRVNPCNIKIKRQIVPHMGGRPVLPSALNT